MRESKDNKSHGAESFHEYSRQSNAPSSGKVFSSDSLYNSRGSEGSFWLQENEEQNNDQASSMINKDAPKHKFERRRSSRKNKQPNEQVDERLKTLAEASPSVTSSIGKGELSYLDGILAPRMEAGINRSITTNSLSSFTGHASSRLPQSGAAAPMTRLVIMDPGSGRPRQSQTQQIPTTPIDMITSPTGSFSSLKSARTRPKPSKAESLVSLESLESQPRSAMNSLNRNASRGLQGVKSARPSVIDRAASPEGIFLRASTVQPRANSANLINQTLQAPAGSPSQIRANSANIIATGEARITPVNSALLINEPRPIQRTGSSSSSISKGSIKRMHM